MGRTGVEGDYLVGVLDRNSKVSLWIFNFEMPTRHSHKNVKKAAKFSSLKLKGGLELNT